MLDGFVMADLTAGPVVLLVLGIVLLLWGRRVFWAAVALAGFAIGWMYGGPLAAAATDSAEVIRWAPLALGVVCAVLAGLLLKVSMFIGGAVIGWFLGAELAPHAGLIIRAAGALVAGGLILASRKVIIVVLTSIVGARMAALGAISLLAGLSVYVSPTAAVLISVVLAVAGIACQLRGRRRS
jgi:hypothetical protein